MNGLRRTFSLRKKKKKTDTSDGTKPQQWLEDETKIKDGCCSFHVKYLGNIEVYESRGMQVCEEAIRALRKSKKKPQKAILYVSGDALRVSDDVSQHLIVDQTIEKVSFCAPDRSHEKGFAYICRDGATRRWMCHAFLASRESGERLSHAVGCAFAICLEKKQKRERDALQLAVSSEDRPLVRVGSFRPTSLVDRLIDPQSAICTGSPPISGDSPRPSTVRISETIAPTSNVLPSDSVTTGAIPRPRPSSSILERQGSLRLFPKLQDASPFKRDLSLRLSELPSNLKRLARNMNGDAIPEEPDVLCDEATRSDSHSSPNHIVCSTVLTTPSSPVTTVKMADLTTAPTYQQHLVPTNTRTTPVAFETSPILNSLPVSQFVDPFSAAPFNPTSTHEHPTNSTVPADPRELEMLVHLSLASKPTVSHLQRAPLTFVTTPNVPTSSFAPALALTAPSVAHWSHLTSPLVMTTATNPSDVTRLPGMTTPVQLPFQTSYLVTQTSTVGGSYALGTYCRVSTASGMPNPWLPSTSPSSSWCAPSPSLLPPEPNRFSDPFDVAWADRALALNASNYKPGNPFLSNAVSTSTAAGVNVNGSATPVPTTSLF